MFIPHDSERLPGGSSDGSTDFETCTRRGTGRISRFATCSSGSEARTLDVETRPHDATNRSLGSEVCNAGSEVCSAGSEVCSAASEVCDGAATNRTYDAEVRGADAAVRSRSSATRHSRAEVHAGGTETCSAVVMNRSSRFAVRAAPVAVRIRSVETRNLGAVICNRSFEVRGAGTTIRAAGVTTCTSCVKHRHAASVVRRAGAANLRRGRANRRRAGAISRHSATVLRALASTSMGRRNHAETMIAIVDAFHEKNTWTQAALAERTGVEVRRVRALLDLLVETRCFPLERMREGAHVYWSLPKRWVAGGVAVSEEDIAPLARLVARSPGGTFRDRILAMLLACAPPRVPRPVEPGTMQGSVRSDFEERMLSLVESSAAQRFVVSVRYITASRGEESSRALSVQRIDARPPARLVAYCHKAKELRTFRVDRLRGAVRDRGLAFVRVDEDEVAAYVARSVDGFHGFGDKVELSRFFVRDPEAHWVKHNLLTPMEFVVVEGGIEVTVKSASVDPIARFVVGLGGAAVPSTPALRAAVRALAEGALEAGKS